MNRRRFLSASGALGAVALAGCTGGLTGRPTAPSTEDPSVESREASYGETVTVARIEITVAEPTVARSQPGPDEGERVSAPEGNRWLFVPVTARNVGDETVALPLTLHFHARVGDTLYQPGRTRRLDRKYVGGRVDPGGVRSGTVGYLVPDGVSASDVAVVYAEGRDSGRVRVRWR